LPRAAEIKTGGRCRRTPRGQEEEGFAIMENVLRDKDIWILGSVCLMATFLWGRLWKLFSAKRRGRASPSAELQVTQQEQACAPENFGNSAEVGSL